MANHQPPLANSSNGHWSSQLHQGSRNSNSSYTDQQIGRQESLANQPPPYPLAFLDDNEDDHPPPPPPHQGHYAMPSSLKHSNHGPPVPPPPQKNQGQPPPPALYPQDYPPPYLRSHQLSYGEEGGLNQPPPAPPPHRLMELSERLMLLEERCTRPSPDPVYEGQQRRPSTLLREIDSEMGYQSGGPPDGLGMSGHNSLSMRFGASCDSPFYRRPSSYRGGLGGNNGGTPATSLSCSSIPQRPPSPSPPMEEGGLSPSQLSPRIPLSPDVGTNVLSDEDTGHCSPTLEYQNSSVFDNSDLLNNPDENSSQALLLQFQRDEPTSDTETGNVISDSCKDGKT